MDNLPHIAANGHRSHNSYSVTGLHVSNFSIVRVDGVSRSAVR